MNTTQPHLMIDIETLDTKPSAAILSIAALYFDIKTGEVIGAPFYSFLSVDSNVIHKRTISGDTLRWWLTQEKSLMKRTLCRVSSDPSNQLQSELKELNHFLLLNGHDTTIWAYSPAFDLVILKDAFAQFNLDWPLRYDKEMDCRTLVNLAGARMINIPNTVEHDALEDCWYQIKQVCRAMSIINSGFEVYDRKKEEECKKN